MSVKQLTLHRHWTSHHYCRCVPISIFVRLNKSENGARVVWIWNSLERVERKRLHIYKMESIFKWANGGSRFERRDAVSPTQRSLSDECLGRFFAHSRSVRWRGRSSFNACIMEIVQFTLWLLWSVLLRITLHLLYWLGIFECFNYLSMSFKRSFVLAWLILNMEFSGITHEKYLIN